MFGISGNNARPPIGITMGCPVGIGPEIIAKLLNAGISTPVVVIGDALVLKRCLKELAIDGDVATWRPGLPVEQGAINVLPVTKLEGLTWGKPNEITNKAMAQYILEAVGLIKENKLGALVTCPITKVGLQQAGYNYPGHTEMLAELCGEENYAMMMAGDRLKVVLLTIHTGLAKVAEQLDSHELQRIIRLAGRTLERDFGMPKPRIAVAGFNPHAGEGGLFGKEESEIISPAVEEMKQEGWDVVGPLPPDTVFFRAAENQFDVVICMYHDQGLIPFKLLHFSDGVNVTAGLPLVRTSVDHGTAYDIAGSGVADSGSLKAAISLADKMMLNRQLK